MIRFSQTGPNILLIYTPESNEGEWLRNKLDKQGKARISGRIFHVTRERLVQLKKGHEEFDDDESFVFEIGSVPEEYFLIDREVLGLNFDLEIHVSIKLERKIFAAERNISIFRRFNDFGLSKLVIGGDDEEALPKEVFLKLLKKFPNSYELTRYAKARVSSIVRNHLPLEQDRQAEYEKYLNKKESHQGSMPLQIYSSYESDKFNDLVEKIENMLNNAATYNESQWQDEILEVIQLLFPRYILAYKEVPVNDSWANSTRRVDFLAIDSAGYIDIIEIKKPSEEHTVTSNCYRGNHVPIRELSGTIMQVEKYLYHFNRWGKAGEQKLTKKYKTSLPNGLEIKIVNPSGLIIMGRDQGLSKDQMNDFEVIRRKYRSIVDIITYDDLLRRLKIIRDNFQQLTGNP